VNPDSAAAGGAAAELKTARGVHARLCAFYFLYYVAVGAFVPYWPLYLQSLGYAPAQIGVAFAVLGLVRVGLPVVWGTLMDRSGHRMPWIAGGMLVSCVFFALIPFTRAFGAMLLLHFVYACFWNVALPAFDVVTLNHIAHTGADYSRVRLWGSVGFVISVAALGPLLDATGIGPVPWIVAGGMIGMGLLGLTIPDAHESHARRPDDHGFFDVLRRPEVLWLLLVCFLSQLSFAPFYSFFSLYLQNHRYDRTTIGALWALGVVAEVFVFIYAGRLIGRFGSRGILLVALATTALRWALLALFVDRLALLAVSQLLHLSSFALYHAVSVYYIHRIFPGRLQGRGQALLAAVSFGLGGSIGSFSGGLIWEHLSPAALYGFAAAIGALGFVVAQRFVPDATRIASRPAIS
jgi:PPP family 3-phenylpropionic acid transporter